MSSPYVKLGNRSLDQWKVTELKEELKRRKLTTKGLKEDLVKRLDEAVRFEMGSSIWNADNDATQSKLPFEQAKTKSDVSETAKNFVDRENDIVEKVDAKLKHEIGDHRGSRGEGKVVVANLVQGTIASAQEGEQLSQLPTVETTAMVSETVESVTALSESEIESQGTIEVGDSTVLLHNDGYPNKDPKLEPSGPNTQSPQINESSMPVEPLSAPTLQGGETQNEVICSVDHRTNDDFKCLQSSPSVQSLKYQVSEVDPDLGFQVTSDPVSTESVSIIQKNELKINVITDNVQLELDVKHEMEQPSRNAAVPDGGESHPMDVEGPLNKNNIEEPLDKEDVQEPLVKKEHAEATGASDAVNVDSLKRVDSGDMGPPEKLSLDQSSGDDSMEEDILQSKQTEDKLDCFTLSVVKSGIPSIEEEDHVDIVGHDKPVETKVKPVGMKITNIENEIVSALNPGKRKFQDEKAVGNNDTVKKARRWNVEGLKSSEAQSGSITPKGLSEPSLKPISVTNSTVNAEAPKERLVPPPTRPASNSLRIDHFLRPFTLKAVQELLGKTGIVTSFWMDHIKSHCYVSYASVEEAVETRNALYNLQWPPNGGRFLVAEFVDPQEVKSHLEAPLASPITPTGAARTVSTAQAPHGVQPQPSPRQHVQRQQLPPSLPAPPLSNPPLARERLHPPREPLAREQPLLARDRLNLPPPPPLPEKVDAPIVTLDDLFRKTKATPRIYYLPLTDEQVAANLKAQGKNVNQ